MNLIDANVFIRYLVGDDATKQRKSKELIDRVRTGQEEAFTTDVIVHEVCYILSASTHYSLSPPGHTGSALSDPGDAGAARHEQEPMP